MMSEYHEELMKAALVRAMRTAAQTAIAVIGSSTVLEQVDWRMVASATILATIVSLLMSIAGLPEVDDGGLDIMEDALASMSEASEDDEEAAHHE